jgi:acetyltransferase-like isoleucine patch superfamily enzyme
MNQFYAKLYRYIVRKVNIARVWHLRLLGAVVGSQTISYGRFFVIEDCKRLTIGNCVSINNGVLFNLSERIIIGDNVHISSNVQLATSSLNLGRHYAKPIYIENNVWLSSGVVISGGCRIGEGSIIGANSVVLSDIPSGVLAAGAPAKIVKKLINI